MFTFFLGLRVVFIAIRIASVVRVVVGIIVVVIVSIAVVVVIVILMMMIVVVAVVIVRVASIIAFFLLLLNSDAKHAADRGHSEKFLRVLGSCELRQSLHCRLKTFIGMIRDASM